MTETGMEFISGILHRQVPAWQPIETARKDGKSVLLFLGDNSIVIARFDEERECWLDDHSDRVWPEPDYWMSLPAPPVDHR